MLTCVFVSLNIIIIVSTAFHFNITTTKLSLPTNVKFEINTSVRIKPKRAYLRSFFKELLDIRIVLVYVCMNCLSSDCLAIVAHDLGTQGLSRLLAFL